MPAKLQANQLVRDILLHAIYVDHKVINTSNRCIRYSPNKYRRHENAYVFVLDGGEKVRKSVVFLCNLRSWNLICIFFQPMVSRLFSLCEDK